MGWSGNEKKQNVFEPKELSFVDGNTFDDDDEEGEQQQFVYKSPAELMLGELEVSMHFYSYLFFKKKGGCKTNALFPFNIRQRHLFSRKITEKKKTKTKTNKPKIKIKINEIKIEQPQLSKFKSTVTKAKLHYTQLAMYFPYAILVLVVSLFDPKK